ncbi:hypothetical protein [Nocardioides sp. YIM 152315]|uniref:hypothetical protein n=1 Tax=Nocardioides sp. YIM 152315 TaxID=3031760 RepID=UPI0023DC87A7|nr:hypothetical protein [Nocardioides sp. YIM 152315]MDF1602751.1 hypothetical protein [Nocardioides sp. YIM 152315]
MTREEALRSAEVWFQRHGLPYFVPADRAAVRAALRPGRTLPLLVAVVLVAVAAGVGLAWFADEITAGPAVLLAVVLVAAVWYALTALRFRPILGWSLSRTTGTLVRLLPNMSRALPLLLVFVTFLFINAEAWQMTASLTPGLLWLTVLLFTAIGVVFLLVRLPEEVDRADDEVDDAFLVRACARTPLEQPCAELVDDPEADPAAYAQVTGFERWNLILALVIVQAVQVLLLAASVFVFFLVFGALVMDEDVQVAWTGLDAVQNVPGLPSVSVQLLKVSVFLADFSGLYLTVSTLTDETYRAQFFSTVTRELERAVGMRAVYLALRAAEDGEPRRTP